MATIPQTTKGGYPETRPRHASTADRVDRGAEWSPRARVRVGPRRT